MKPSELRIGSLVAPPDGNECRVIEKREQVALLYDVRDNSYRLAPYGELRWFAPCYHGNEGGRCPTCNANAEAFLRDCIEARSNQRTSRYERDSR